MVVARVTESGNSLDNLALSFTSSPGLEVSVAGRSSSAGDIVWPVNIRVIAGAPDHGVVDFRLAYSVLPPATDGDAAPPLGRRETHLQRAQVAVSLAPGLDASPTSDAEVSIKTNFASIAHNAGGTAYLTIKNNSNYQFAVDKVNIDLPEFMTAKPDCPNSERTSRGALCRLLGEVQPHATQEIPVDITIPNETRLGDWKMLASVTLRRGEGGDQRFGTLTVEQPVTVGVPGVSDVLRVLDLPSLLVVPGALVVAMWSILTVGADANRPNWLTWKSSGFWVVAVTISICMFGLARWFGVDFLTAYNAEDVGALWLASVAGGGVSFFIYKGALKGAKVFRIRLAEKERQAREPVKGDFPLPLLKKLHRANLPFYLQAFDRDGKSQKQQLFKLAFAAPDGKAWVIPKLLVTRLGNGSEAAEALKRISAENDKPNDLGGLILELQQSQKGGLVELKWEDGEVTGPTLLPAGEIVNPASGPESPLELA